MRQCSGYVDYIPFLFHAATLCFSTVAVVWYTFSLAVGNGSQAFNLFLGVVHAALIVLNARRLGLHRIQANRKENEPDFR